LSDNRIIQQKCLGFRTTSQQTLRQLTGVLGLCLAEKKAASETDPFAALLVELRKQKFWVLSDLVRDKPAALGVVFEDGKDATTWRWG
jgi:cysteinyl-tRNA synthetase